MAMAEQQDYSQWSQAQLQERIITLETRLESLEHQLSKSSSNTKVSHDRQHIRRPSVSHSGREFEPSKYSSRLIALKFAYLGQKYNGFEYHANNTTRLPTIEETLWKALMKARLIFPTPNPAIAEGEPNFEGCEYSKCGRTDKGVSAFGQVIGVRVRSNRPLSQFSTPLGAQSNGEMSGDGSIDLQKVEVAAPTLGAVEKETDISSPTSTMSFDNKTLSLHPIHDEIPYCKVLNRLLPPDIRVLAWCPTPPLDFSARFSCRERQYTYFFTQPAFTPTPVPRSAFRNNQDSTDQMREGYLDISAMQAAAKKFEGLHDFRNFCKTDASKQIENFERRIFHADVTEYRENSNNNIPDKRPISAPASLEQPHLYTIIVHGSAFLWHQIRHMAAILFLVGQGLEAPSVVDELLDITKTPSKPQYEMADDAPLMLWDCIFPREGGPVDPRTGRGLDAMEWVYVGDDDGGNEASLAKRAEKTDGKYGFGGVVDDIWKVWRRRKMDEVLAGTLLNMVVGQENSSAGEGVHHERPDHHVNSTLRQGRNSQKVFQGGDGPKYAGVYVPVMQKPRMESVEVINERYREKRGFETREEVKQMGMRSIVLERKEDVID